MSRGCFRVSAFVFQNYTLNDNAVEIARVESATKLHNVFIPAKDILQVKLFETYSDFCNAHASCMRDGRSRIEMVHGICKIEKQQSCSCGVLQKFKQFDDAFDLEAGPLEQYNKELRRADACATMCMCKLQIFPLYEIVVQNNSGEIMTAGPIDF